MTIEEFNAIHEHSGLNMSQSAAEQVRKAMNTAMDQDSHFTWEINGYKDKLAEVIVHRRSVSTRYVFVYVHVGQHPKLDCSGHDDPQPFSPAMLWREIAIQAM